MEKVEKVNEATLILLAIVCFSFCLLASTLLIYYLRLRYNLRLSILGFPRENLWKINYQNHIKNLKINARSRILQL